MNIVINLKEVLNKLVLKVLAINGKLISFPLNTPLVISINTPKQ